ncbi:MAG: DUF1553 domain-containing protein [Planctomycetota bacterium]|nr:DUF1553 domain-containing protein [Planctomycetota bacterium]
MKKMKKSIFLSSISRLLVVIQLGWLLPSALLALPLQDEIDYNRSIRPLLADRCYPCHGPDGQARKAKLRLDRREDALAARTEGSPIVPGDPSASLMIERLHLDDPEDQMPPPESKLEVSPAEIALLERWIEQGAPFDRHWAFVAPEPPALPEVSDESWSKQPLDRFILSRLEDEGIAAATEADRTTLARRASFVLTGLAPELEALESFLADDSPDAWHKWIDSLLASPTFGEQMATHWLDIARYADSYGYQSDVHRQMWQWRDWVIDAFNSNLTHDQFITQQVAGDLLADATSQQKLATAFQRLHRQTNEGGSVEEEYRIEYIADRTQTFSTAFLGLTFECARCHNHKFDPIQQREYYALSAFFSNIDESGLYSHFTAAVPTPALTLFDQQAKDRVVELTTEVNRAEQHLNEVMGTRLEAFELWQQQQKDTQPPPFLTDVAGHFAFDEVIDAKSPNQVDPEHPAKVPGSLSLSEGVSGKAIQLTGDDALGFDGLGAYSRNDPFTISLWIRTEQELERAVILHRSRAWTDAGSQGYQLLIENGRLSAALIHFWPGDAIAVSTTDRIEVGQWTHVVFSYDGSSRAAGIQLWLDGVPAEVEIVRDHLRSPITGGGPYFAIGERFRDNGFKYGQVDEMHILNRSISEIEVRKLFSDVDDPQAEFSSNENELLNWWLLAVDEECRTARAGLTAARKALSGFTDSKAKIMVMSEMAQKRTTHMLRRGRYDAPGEVVEPDVPAVLPPMPIGASKDRLALARWLVSPEHPLTARVAVNRLWQIGFGAGIVPTSEDFGTQGTRPSHPQLLDHLALDFIDSGWDVKRMFRKILTSSTWMQSSTCSATLWEKDPANRLLARGPSVRMSAEMVRDHALQASGLLVGKIGGPSVLPYQPPGLWQEKSGHTYTASKGEGLYRRSLYTFWKRTSPPPTMMIFDASKRDVCVTRRHRTSTPMQSLVLMNDPQFVEAARMLARRALLTNGDDLAGAISYAFRLLLGRPIQTAELDTLLALRDQLYADFSVDAEAVVHWLAIGDSAIDESLDAANWAAMAAVCSTLFNHDETTRLR